MRFGRIDYLNLLPFHVFMKRYLRSSQAQMMLRHGANVPSQINRDYRSGKIDAAFISSIRAKAERHLGLGIAADGAVQSVLLFPLESLVPDSASETSNALARVLGLQGRVLIGDPALRAYLSGAEAVDLAQEWKRRTGLPFVFAVLSVRRKSASAERLARAFMRQPVKIPRYLLQRAALRSGVEPEAIQAYLRHIHYRLDHQDLRALHRFWRLVQQKKVL
jgi:chorismate dehydratase